MKLQNITTKVDNKQNFKGADPYKTLTGALKVADLFIQSQENLSSTRFIQDTATNWFPKAVFARSKADFAEMTFLEMLESGIFYFALPILGEKVLRNNVFKHIPHKNIKSQVNELIPKTLNQIKNSNVQSEIKKQAVSSKAGILLACALIPIAEYTLSFAKNLFTLKTFKTSDFNKIAKLYKEQKTNDTRLTPEEKAQQERVEKNSKKQLKKAGLLSLGFLAAGLALAKNGSKSESLQKIAQSIIEPGQAVASGLGKLGVKNDKLNNILSKFSLDFASNNGKLALGKGQLALTAILGLFGYSKAAEDRGKLDVAEVWTRVPLVVFYTIFGSELFEKGFINLLAKKNKFPDLIQKDKLGKLTVPTREQLPKLAETLAKQNKTQATDELKKLVKQKTFTTAIPYAFALLFMGFTLSAITRLWTQFRYNHQQKQEQKSNNHTLLNFQRNLPPLYKDFAKKNV